MIRTCTDLIIIWHTITIHCMHFTTLNQNCPSLTYLPPRTLWSHRWVPKYTKQAIQNCIDAAYIAIQSGVCGDICRIAGFQIFWVYRPHSDSIKTGVFFALFQKGGSKLHICLFMHYFIKSWSQFLFLFNPQHLIHLMHQANQNFCTYLQKYISSKCK